MKKVFTTILSLAALPLFAQVVIDQSNFTRTAGLIDAGFQANATGVVAPSHGDNQTWDYSGLVNANPFTTVWIDASGDTDFPTALNYRDQQLSFQGFPISAQLYEAVDADGWYDLGRVLEEATYSITAISGGANDVLQFPAQVQVYEGRLNTLDFPVEFEKTWTQSYIEHTQFNLTVAAFGLDNAPGEAQRIHTHTRSVVGQGQLIIPNASGNPSGPLDALLLRIERSAVDSTFLGGSPAPAPLMSAFGLTQGSTVTAEFYAFYIEGFYHTPLNINLDAEGNVSSVFYRPAAAELATSIGNITTDEVGIYPNPVAAGDVLTIAGNNVAVTAEVVDMTGRMVFSSAIPANAGNARINLPAGMVPGLYSLVLRGSDAAPVSVSKIIVR
jgi:hypothetical protein